MAIRARITIALCIFTCIGCRLFRAATYQPGTPLATIVAELGPPDEDKLISPAFAGLCPSDTVRVVEYFGPRSVALLLGYPSTILCIDKSNRVLETLHSVS